MRKENPYQERGFQNRKEYLADVADNHGLSLDQVLEIANLLGKEEDFDGLISECQDLEYANGGLFL
jgi:hypothetical protein